MTDLTFLDPPIEVAASSPRLDMILARLKASGMRAYPARPPVDFTANDPLLLDLESVTSDTLERCARACMAGVARQLVLLDTSQTGVNITDAIVLRRDRDLAILKARLASLARRDLRTREVARRRDTAIALGARPPRPDPEATPHLLYLGDGSHLFLSMQSALKERGLAVTAALSLLTAQDYMLSRRFSALLVDLTPRARDANAFIGWTSPEGAPAGAALFVLVDPEHEPDEAQRFAMAQAAEVIYVDSPPEVIAARLEKFARQYMVSAPLLPETGMTSAISDLSTGFFSRRFLEAHLEKQMQDSASHDQPLCMLTLKLNGPAAMQRGALQALAASIAPNLRETDCPALIGAGTIGVSLLATAYRGGVVLAERIALAASRQNAIEPGSLTWRVVERRAYHTPKTLLGAGVTGPFMRAGAA